MENTDLRSVNLFHYVIQCHENFPDVNLVFNNLAFSIIDFVCFSSKFRTNKSFSGSKSKGLRAVDSLFDF